MKIIKLLFVLIISISTTDLSGNNNCFNRNNCISEKRIILIPTPQNLKLLDGKFILDEKTKIVLGNSKDEEDLFSSQQLIEEIKTELNLPISLSGSVKGKTILLGIKTRDILINNAVNELNIEIPSQIGEEGYVLHISPQKIIIVANSSTGVFYGVQTLKQIIRANRTENSIPCLTITDWPTLRYRGWMDDISRGPIPKMDFLKEIIRTMAEYKQNMFTLYTEHVFKLKSYPDIAPQDGISSEEIAELSLYASKYHIDLIGNFQSFGHMGKILGIPFFNNLRENSDVLNPSSEETYKFLENIYSEIVPSYKSKFFNINCDEVFGLGEGKSKNLIDSIGLEGVYAYHISRIDKLLKPYGKRIMMWGDIAVNNQKIIDQLPKDLIILSWGYHAAESFDDAILPFKKTGFDFMVAPGVSCWGEVWPNMTNAMINISNYVRDGTKLGAMGMLNTAWDDSGENLFNNNWHGLLWGAECSWKPAKPLTGNEAKIEREERFRIFNQSFDRLFFGNTDFSAMNILLKFDSIRNYPIEGIVRDEAIWKDLLEIYPANTGSELLRYNEKTISDSKLLLNDLKLLKKNVKRNAEKIDYAIFAAKRVNFTAIKNIVQIKLANAIESKNKTDIANVQKELQNLLQELYTLKIEYINFWNKENRSWWLDQIMQKYDRLGNRILSLDKIVFIEPSKTVIENKRNIELRTIFNDKPIYYTIDGSIPTNRSNKYSAPFQISNSSLIRAKVIENKQSAEMAEKFVLVHKGIGKLFKLNSKYSIYNHAYSAGGELGLVDGLKGSDNYADGRWQGYQGQDLDVILYYDPIISINKISISFLQNSFSWILMPSKIQISVSDDGKEFKIIKEIPNPINPKEEGAIIYNFTSEFKELKTKFLRIVGVNPGKLPEWHRSSGNESFIFADEIIIE